MAGLQNHNAVIVRYAEIALKGKNRVFFERVLVDNIRKCLHKNSIEFDKIKRIRGRIIVYTSNCCSCLKTVFGISSFSSAVVSDPDVESIFSAALPLIPDLKNRTFRVTTQRIDKSMNITSGEVDREIGAMIVAETNAGVSLKNFDFELGIEIIDGKAYIFTERINGPGGLPVGTQGNILAVIDNKNYNNSVLAALLLMKRGCRIIPVEITGSRSESSECNKSNINILRVFNCAKESTLISSLSDLLGIIKQKIKQNNVDGVCFGDTIDAFEFHESELGNGLLVLLPLAGMNSDEAKDLVKEYEKFG